MNILIYHPANQTAKDVEALAEAYIYRGYNVYLLTHSEKGILHDNISKLGGKVFSVKKFNRFYYFNQIVFLIKFCKSNKIDVVYSNLQQCSIIAIFSQFFIKSEVITWRHHSDSVYLYGTWKEKIIDKLINSLSKYIIVISNFSYSQIINVEKVKANKVNLIHLGYNFNFFTKTSDLKINQIKNQYNAKLLLVIVGRLIPLKRVNLAIETISDLVASGYDVKLMILGTGELEEDLKKAIIQKRLIDNVFLIGHVNNVQDYIAAADLLIHTSNSEASCHMPKEAGVLSKPVLVCENVGDFSDYIEDGFNGIVIDKNNTIQELKLKLIDVYENRIDISKLGNQLKKTVEKRFDINEIIKLHQDLLIKQ